MSSGWLLDTNVLSATGPGKRPLPPAVVSWFKERTESLYFSTVTAAEVEAGITRLYRLGSDTRADNLREWFDRIVELYDDRILPFDLAAAVVAGALGDLALAAGSHPGFADVAIAATAKSRELVVVTLNRWHFEPLGVEIINPFAPQ
ncbi:MAG TPA: PIN domain-containing protein [Stellaceae bacterium]